MMVYFDLRVIRTFQNMSTLLVVSRRSYSAAPINQSLAISVSLSRESADMSPPIRTWIIRNLELKPISLIYQYNESEVMHVLNTTLVN